MLDQEGFFAWLDGELEPDQAAQYEAHVAQHPDLAELANSHRALKRQLQAAFDQVTYLPMSRGLEDAIGVKNCEETELRKQA